MIRASSSACCGGQQAGACGHRWTAPNPFGGVWGHKRAVRLAHDPGTSTSPPVLIIERCRRCGTQEVLP